MDSSEQCDDGFGVIDCGMKFEGQFDLGTFEARLEVGELFVAFPVEAGGCVEAAVVEVEGGLWEGVFDEWFIEALEVFAGHGGFRAAVGMDEDSECFGGVVGQVEVWVFAFGDDLDDVGVHGEGKGVAGDAFVLDVGVEGGRVGVLWFIEVIDDATDLKDLVGEGVEASRLKI